MAIQEDLCAVLVAGGVAGGRAYHWVARDGVTKPYVTYFRMSVVPVNTLSSGRPLENTVFQIDAYDKTAAGVNRVKDSIKAALDGWAIKNVIQSEQDIYEPDTKLHRVTMNVSVYAA